MSSLLSRPKSSVPVLSGYLSIIYVVVAYFWWPRDIVGLEDYEEATLFLLSLFTFIALYELLFVRVYRAEDSGLDFKQKFSLSKLKSRDFYLKVYGLVIPYVFVGIFYWVFDLYYSDFYEPFFEVLKYYGWVIVIVLIVYFPVVHLCMRNPRDSYSTAGLFFLSLGKLGDKKEVRNHLLSVMVKAFFIPLMFCYFVQDWSYFREGEIVVTQGFDAFFSYGYRFLFFIDIAYTVVGYVITSRVLNSHIRWVDDHPGGWFFCLVCYMPFWQLIGREYLNYGDDIVWQSFADTNELVYVCLGSLVLLTSAIYVISSAHFGLRFSNLTYRGLVSHGAFRFTKHPAYVSKNISWWLMDVPFIASEWSLALKNSITLLLINFIYYMRAYYEEKCLDSAPEYRQYKDYMAVHGWFSFERWRKVLNKTKNKR